MDKQTLKALVAGNPQVAQAADIIEARIANMPGVTEEMIDQLVQTLEHVLEDPQRYPQVRAAAIRAGFGTEQDFPAEYDPVLIVSMLVALYEVQAREQGGRSQAFARGGLARAAERVASAGRGGDTMLAHINPREAAVLSRMGGAGTVNPNTGIVEFKGGVGKLVAAIAPVALSIIAPGVGTAIGAALGAGATMAPIIGGAVIGGAAQGLAGGNVMHGALGGALAGGAGQALGGALAPSMGAGAQNVLGSALVGGAQGALSGQGVGTGLAQGAVGGAIGNALSGAASGVSGGLGAGLQTAGRQVGNALTMGATPQQALVQGGLSGLAASATYTSPADAVINSMKSGELVGPPASQANVLASDGPGELVGPPASQAGKPMSGLESAAKVLPLLALLDSANTPQQVQSAASRMSPEQRAYFDRPLKTWNWDALAADARAQGLPLGSFISRNWNKVVGGAYDNPAGQAPAQPATPAPSAPTAPQGGQGFASGGLSSLARLATGGGTGRSDSIDARLSDGEYVMDAETVALLGDGSTQAGARRLDEMRAKIRQHKGRALARGKISADAKSPLAYLKGV